jgi:SAM-dependent methyltransferase
MLKEKIMRFCINSFLKIEEHDGGLRLRTQTGEDGEMDEEDHEALCTLFRTIGATIDKPKAQPFMMVYFSKIEKISDDKALSSRLRFMYKDLIEMRSKGWKLRREVETAKSLDEIRKDAEREERMAQMQIQQGGGGRGLSKSKGSVIRCLTEEEGYYFAGFTCDQNCPCEKHDFFDIFTERMMRLSHCLNCSSLGISLPLSPFTCQIACVNSGRYHSSHKCFSVDIPNDVADWYKHGIVEVMYEGTTSLKFIRIRRDRKHANSESVANTILKNLLLSPIDISSIHFKSSAKSAVKYQSTNTHYRRSLDTDTIDRCSLSEFKNLRVHHLRIKGWLYRAFGGRRIIDACVGGLNDIQNWLDAGLTFVLAIDRDEGQLNTARSRLNDYGTTNKLREIQISIVEGDLSLPIDLYGGPFETVFCNFAMHYFWNTRETIMCFLNNLASVLDNNGRFVITYLRGEELLRERSIKIYSKSGKLEFSADMIEEGSHLAEIFVASIGIPHIESVMVLDDMISCFKEAGFNYVASIPFKTFTSILPSGSILSSKELDMSCLYSAAVFEKWLPCQEQNSFFPIRYPPNLEFEALSYLDIPDLVKGRRVCNFWKTVIDHHVQIPSQTKVTFFDQHIVEYDPDYDQYETKMGKEISPPALAMFLRWGGRVSTKEGIISTQSSLDDRMDGWSDWSDYDGGDDRMDGWSDWSDYDGGGLYYDF